MTTIDGIPGRWRPWLPGVAQAPAEALAAAEGCTVPEAVAQAVLDAYVVCTTDAPGDRMHPAKWWAGSNACCDDHIPDGWVRPDEVITTTLPPACDTCGERSEHEVCS